MWEIIFRTWNVIGDQIFFRSKWLQKMPKTGKIPKPLDFGAWPFTFKMSRGQKVTRKKFLDSLDLYTCQISSNSIGGFSRSATGHAFPYWGKITTRARRGPTQLAKFSTGKKNPQPPRWRAERVVEWICVIRTIGARQRANGLSSVGKLIALFTVLRLL